MDFCDTLADILKKAKTEQHKNCFRYGELYRLNYYKEVKKKDRTYYEVYSLPRTDARAHFYTPFGVPCEHPLPLPVGEVAERSEDGEGKS